MKLWHATVTGDVKAPTANRTALKHDRSANKWH